MKKLSVLFLLTVVSTSSMAAVKRCPLHYRNTEAYKHTIVAGVGITGRKILECYYYMNLPNIDMKLNEYRASANNIYLPDQAQVLQGHWGPDVTPHDKNYFCHISREILHRRDAEAARDYCRFTEEAA